MWDVWNICLQALNCAFRCAGMREKDDQDLRLIELDTPVNISGLCLIDCKQVTV